MKDLAQIMVTLFLVAGLVFGVWCVSKNYRAKHFGSTITYTLEKNTKLINCSWKETGAIWLLTKPMNSNDVPETYNYQEKSTFGILNGNVILIETR